MRFIPAILLISVLIASVSHAQGQVAQKSTAVTSKPPSPAAQAPVSDDQALRDDIKKMRVLLHQMETNLAFVDSGQTALKHQFQLEIEMWRSLIDQMERRLPGSSH
jgi:hypothetical protein